MSIVKQNEFLMKKQYAARHDQNGKALMMQQRINDYESEAVELERMEANLLVRLQDTQKQERDAFVHLESAMVDASIPKNVRKLGSQSYVSNKSNPSKSSGSLNPQFKK